jgi:CRISPR system Cascade subunit CasE
MMYFSRVKLDRNAPTRALYPLLEPQNPSARMDVHHRLIWTLFPSAPEQKRDFLWRADGAARFFILSARPPESNDLFCQPLETKEFIPDLSPGDRLAFTLRANATKDRPRSKLDNGKNRRVDVVMHALKSTPGQQDLPDTEQSHRPALRFKLASQEGRKWLDQQGARNGFSLNSFVLEDYSIIPLPRRKNSRARREREPKFGVLDMRGTLTVTDPYAFLSKLSVGFGRAKGFGCGLMLIRRA